MSSSSHPGVLDYVARFSLKLAKRRRKKYQGKPGDFYEGFFVDKDLHQARYDLRFRMRQRGAAQALDEALGKRGRPLVLDVGCGVGHVIGMLPESWCKVGLAYSNADLSLARRLAGGSVRFLRGRAEVLPFPSASLDAILCLEVLEHLPDDDDAVREFARVLKPGGVLVVSVPAEHYFLEYLDLIGHFRHYSREQLETLLNKHQLTIKRYIDRHATMERLHHFPYMALEGLHRTLNACHWRRQSLYVRPIIGALYNGIAWSLAPWCQDQDQRSLAKDSRSTFVLSEKLPIAVHQNGRA